MPQVAMLDSHNSQLPEEYTAWILICPFTMSLSHQNKFSPGKYEFLFCIVWIVDTASTYEVPVHILNKQSQTTDKESWLGGKWPLAIKH